MCCCPLGDGTGHGSDRRCAQTDARQQTATDPVARPEVEISRHGYVDAINDDALRDVPVPERVERVGGSRPDGELHGQRERAGQHADEDQYHLLDDALNDRYRVCRRVISSPEIRRLVSDRPGGGRLIYRTTCRMQHCAVFL